jgi:hypothetical protein
MKSMQNLKERYKKDSIKPNKKEKVEPRTK